MHLWLLCIWNPVKNGFPLYQDNVEWWLSALLLFHSPQSPPLPIVFPCVEAWCLSVTRPFMHWYNSYTFLIFVTQVGLLGIWIFRRLSYNLEWEF